MGVGYYGANQNWPVYCGAAQAAGFDAGAAGRAFGGYQQNGFALGKRQFMLESVCISLLGGLPGGAAGFLKSSYMFTAKQAGFLLLPVLVGLAFALAVGVLAGYYPASQAAKMEPVAAINAD